MTTDENLTDLRSSAAGTGTPDTLRRLEQRVLWLATSMIHHANRVRPNRRDSRSVDTRRRVLDGVDHDVAVVLPVAAGDRVSVKPHASPVLHGINYLLGGLDESYLTTLREFGGLQSYPSRTKDPDAVDYSTGSVGIGATAPIWGGAVARRYLDTTIGGPRCGCRRPPFPHGPRPAVLARG